MVMSPTTQRSLVAMTGAGTSGGQHHETMCCRAAPPTQRGPHSPVKPSGTPTQSTPVRKPHRELHPQCPLGRSGIPVALLPAQAGEPAGFPPALLSFPKSLKQPGTASPRGTLTALHITLRLKRAGAKSHASDFFPYEATPTSQLTSLSRFLPKLARESTPPVPKHCHFHSRPCQSNPKKPNPLPRGVDASRRLLQCSGWGKLAACVGMPRAVCPGAAVRAFNRCLVPAPGKGAANGTAGQRCHTRRCRRELASHASSGLRQDAGPKKAPCGCRMTRWARS